MGIIENIGGEHDPYCIWHISNIQSYGEMKQTKPP